MDENVFVKIIEGTGISKEETLKLFMTNEKELKEILKGKKVPPTEVYYNLTKRFSVSMDYLMKGKPKTIADQRIEMLWKRKLVEDKNAILVIDFQEYLLENNVKVTKTVTDIFDPNTKSVNTYKLLALDNFELVDALSKSKFNVNGGFKISPFKESDSENTCTNFDAIKDACGELYVKDILTDDGFADYALQHDAYRNARIILNEISKGQRKWNPELILKLISKGAAVQKVQGIFNGELVFEDDFVTTKLLEKLCKDELKK